MTFDEMVKRGLVEVSETITKVSPITKKPKTVTSAPDQWPGEAGDE